MTPQELVARGGIYFEKIQNGMSEYAWESEYFSPRMADRFIRELWKKNGDEGSFVDCYYPFLEQESKERILSVLQPQQQEYLKNLEEKGSELLIPLDEEILAIALELIDREMLFFTFYFVKEPCTIWGNYKQEYLIFTPDMSKQRPEEETCCLENENRMKIFAHRGFSGKYPENTMLAFRKAYETGCDWI